MTEKDEDLSTQIMVLREEIKQHKEDMADHKKIVAAIYQKIQGSVETADKKTNSAVTTALESIRAEIRQTVDEGMRDGGEYLEAVAEKVGNKHNQEMNGLWRFLPMASILLGLLAGLVGGTAVYFLMPKIDSDMAARLQTGAFFESVWPKLSKNEQDKLTAIAEGKEPEKLGKKSQKT
jgi:hypothetical protein